VRPVAPRIGYPEVTFAEEQEEYLPVTIAIRPLGDGQRGLVWRFTFTPGERAAIAAGEDVYIQQLNFGGPMTPMSFLVGPTAFVNPTDGATTNPQQEDTP